MYSRRWIEAVVGVFLVFLVGLFFSGIFQQVTFVVYPGRVAHLSENRTEHDAPVDHIDVPPAYYDMLCRIRKLLRLSLIHI